MANVSSGANSSRPPSELVARRTFLGATAAITFGLAGCRSAVDEEPTGDPTSGSGRSGGTLQIATNVDPVLQGSVLAGRAGNYMWYRNVFDFLITYDENRVPQPQLATKWSFSNERREMSIQVREGVNFHSGRTMTADDVVFTLEQVKLPANASQMQSIMEGITVTATGQYEVTFTSETPMNSIFDIFELTPIVDQETFAEVPEGKAVVGTGPFVWKSWSPGAEILLERNPGYWKSGFPLLDAIQVLIIPDATAELTAIKTERVHVAAGLLTTDSLSLTSTPDFVLIKSGGNQLPFGLDVNSEPFTDKSVRQAIGYALDRERINQQVFGGIGTPTDLFWSTNEPGYTEELANYYTYQPDKARDMIVAAGAAGATVPITVPQIAPIIQSIYEIVQNNLAEVGLVPKAVPMSAAAFDPAQSAGELGPAFVLGHGQVGFSASTLLSTLPSLRPGNPSHFASEEYDRLKLAVQAASEEEAPSALAEISRYLLDEAFTHMLVSAPKLLVHSSKANGVRMSSIGALIAEQASIS